jgi:ribosomal-protein-alanine N-acetyltransferase
LIREVKLDDFNDYKEIVQNPLTTRWRIHGYDRPMTELEARWTFFIDIFYPKGTWSYALEEKASGKLIGIVSLYDEKPIPGYSIGYTINHEFWNKGYATEINEALVHYVFDETDKEYVSAECATGNIASRRVLEKSLLKFEGVSRYSDYIQGRPVDEAIYGLTRSEYESL